MVQFKKLEKLRKMHLKKLEIKIQSESVNILRKKEKIINKFL